MILRNPDSNATTHRSPAVFPLYVCHTTPASLLSHFQTLKIEFVFDLFAPLLWACGLPNSMLGIHPLRSQYADTAFKPHTRGSTVSGFLQTVLSKAPNQLRRNCGRPVGALPIRIYRFLFSVGRLPTICRETTPPRCQPEQRMPAGIPCASTARCRILQ